LDSYRLCAVVMVLVVCGLVKSLLRVLGLPWIPDAGACIAVGTVVGLLLHWFNPNVVQSRLTFDNNLFLNFMLPPIIFEAAISIDKKAFRRDVWAILTFAFLGTVFSALAIGYITWELSSWGSGPSLPLLDSLLFGALASSIDVSSTPACWRLRFRRLTKHYSLFCIAFCSSIQFLLSACGNAGDSVESRR
jgi:NhaP-type Na+/H+ or K+/H+ antiporter